MALYKSALTKNSTNLPPTINNLPDFDNIYEPVLIQAFIEKQNIKMLEKSILSEFNRPN